MNSIELTRELYKKGYLSKKAAVRTLRERDKLVKEALFRESYAFFKEAGLMDFFRKFTVGGKTPIGKGTQTGWSDVGGNLTKILALAGLTSASAAGISAVSQYRRDKKLKGEVAQSYAAMKKEYPRIKEMDQEKVRNHFGVLARYAPSLAANPTVAGAFVTTHVQRNLIDPAMIRTLAQTKETIDQVRDKHTSGFGFGNATSLAQSAMLGGGGG